MEINTEKLNLEGMEFVDENGVTAPVPTAEEMAEDREARNTARDNDLARTKEEVVADTERMISEMNPKQKRVYERLSKFVFRKRCKRTLYVAVSPNRAAQIPLGVNMHFDSGEYAVADALNILAAAAMNSASVFMKYQRVGYAMDGLSGFVIDRGRRVAAIPTKYMKDSWNIFLKDATFTCKEPVFFVQSTF